MELKEAIIHARQIAEAGGVDGRDCAYQHDKLVDWLEELQDYYAIGTADEFRAALSRIAEDDKARAEGRLVVFPFREGEPRYTIEKREPCQEESGDVCECLYPENDDCVECRISHGAPYVQEYTSDSLRIAKRSIEQYYDAIGKTVFLTREAAEAALGGKHDG